MSVTTGFDELLSSRLVTTARHPEFPGRSRRTCEMVAALSSTISMLRSACGPTGTAGRNRPEERLGAATVCVTHT
ncbi:hypothetical protein [Sinosporangium siamense]|uniref:hypothetical protein n=1 Tax=Sinosporangium siamense TaxID=1367973 RepID=UPI00195028F5|nr:hypothetical protein [Sinosporangium siamense]